MNEFINTMKQLGTLVTIIEHQHGQTLQCKNGASCQFKDKCIYCHPADKKEQVYERFMRKYYCDFHSLNRPCPYGDLCNKISTRDPSDVVKQKMKALYDKKYSQKKAPVAAATTANSKPMDLDVLNAKLDQITRDIGSLSAKVSLILTKLKQCPEPQFDPRCSAVSATFPLPPIDPIELLDK